MTLATEQQNTQASDYNVEDIVDTAVINHEEKTIVFTGKNGETAKVTFDEYDEWGSFEMAGRTLDWHILFDEDLGLWVYGLTELEDGQFETDCENEVSINFNETPHRMTE